MRLIKNKFNKSLIGVLFTSFYGYLPYVSSFLLILGSIKNIYIDKRLFLKSFLLLSILILSYLLTLNINIFRIVGLVALNIILYSIIFNSRFEKLKFDFLTDRLFYFHSIIIIIAYLFPSINLLLTSFNEQTNRVAGLVGYDYMGFFYCTYLFTEYRCLGGKINRNFIYKILLSTFFILISGRFGIIILMYFFIYIFFQRINFAKIFSIFLLFFASISLFYQQVSYLISSYKAFYSYLVYNNTSDLNDLTIQDTDAGYYSASPITWVNMFAKPFIELKNYIFPSRASLVVDPGPSYLILNIGLLITIFVYIYFSNFFKIKNKIYWPLLVVFLITDIKYHGIFVPSCMFWVYLNMYKIRSVESTI